MQVRDSGDKDTPARFYEVQYFWQQPLSWFVWIVTGGSVWYLSSEGLIYSTFAIIVLAITAIMVVVVSFTNLVTEISADGISYRMWPFHKKNRLISWQDVEKCEIRKYRPIGEYGGWGVRIGTKGKAYNVKGNMGLQLVLNDGKRILIGTQRPEQMQEVLDQLNVKSHS